MIDSISDYFIYLSKPKTKHYITNLKLQKILYYTQGEHLSEYGEVLFEDRIIAGSTGPSVTAMFKRFSRYSFDEISKSEVDKGRLRLIKQKGLDVFLSKVWSRYGHLNGRQLEAMAKREKPWLTSRGNLPIYVSGREMCTSLIKDYFRKEGR